MKRSYDVILFDLDGTLTDPGLGITNSVMYALAKWDITVADRRELYKFIGPPLLDSFAEFYGFSESDSRLALKYYREYFADKGIFENDVYDGVEDMLRTLKAAGKTIALATSKPQEYAERILEHFGLHGYFDIFAGANMEETLCRKPDIIRYALEQAGASDLSRFVMVGDREHDILGAKECGLDSIGVLFGYGSREELEAAGATHIAATVADITRIVM